MTEISRQRLQKTLQEVRGRIQAIRERHENIGEQNTKATLIDPMLLALGWNIMEYDEVRREYKRKPQDNPVDYALFLQKVDCLFIEAKSLEKDIHDRKWTSQMLSYAMVCGVEWCVLTNGDEYCIYNSHAPVDVDEKLFRSVRISDETQEDYLSDTLELLSKENMRDKRIKALWKAQFIDRHVKAALEDLFSGKDNCFVRLIRKRTPDLSPSDIRESIKRANLHADYSILPNQPLTASTKRDNDTHTHCISSPNPPQPEPLPAPLKKEGILNALINSGLIIPPMTLKKDYRGVLLTATILEDGVIIFNGERFDSLSTSAGMARKTVIGAPTGRWAKLKFPATNGWTFWKFTVAETGELKDIDLLRQQYFALKRSTDTKGL